MSIKRKQIVLIIEFFRNQNPIEIENMLRELSKRKKFPSFHTIIPMVSAYNIKQIKSIPFPVVINKDDLEREVKKT